MRAGDYAKSWQCTRTNFQLLLLPQTRLPIARLSATIEHQTDNLNGREEIHVGARSKLHFFGHLRHVLVRFDAFATRFDADHLHRLVFKERIEESDRIGPSADTGDQQIRQASLLLQNLSPRLVTDDSLKIAHHDRVRMRAVSGAENI